MYERWMIPKDHYHLRKSKLEKNILKRKKRLGKDNMSSQDMISPVFGKRLVPANTHFTSLRKLRKHKFTSDKINDEICKHILNYNERELLSVGQTTMTGGQLEKYVNEGDNGDKILRAFITCFACDEKFNQGNITTVIPPHEVSEEGELSKVDAAQLVEEIKAVLKGTNVARVRKDTESTKDPKVKVFRNMRRTFIFFPFYKNEELFVFHVDTKRLPIIDALFCKMSSLSFEDRS